MKRSAVTVLTHGGGRVKGVVRFREKLNNLVEIDLDISGLRKNGIHGFHIHEYGDLTEGCKSACKHFNPYNVTHGGPDSKIRHVGDLGNIKADIHGKCNYKFTDHRIKLKGRNNIIGRSVVIHDKEDDLGEGGGHESLKTGNAGKRIACGVIGISNSG